MENVGYLFAVFSIVWLVIFGYVIFLANTQKRLLREVESLRETLAEKKLE